MPDAPDQRSEGSAEFGPWRESDTPAAKRAETCEAGQDEPNDSEESDVRGGPYEIGTPRRERSPATPELRSPGHRNQSETG
jgi:hypothetical protein